MASDGGAPPGAGIVQSGLVTAVYLVMLALNIYILMTKEGLFYISFIFSISSYKSQSTIPKPRPGENKKKGHRGQQDSNLQSLVPRKPNA